MSEPSSSESMVIIGAGHCGGRAALSLREKGWTGPITVIGEESHPPYERPALSKSLLAGDVHFESLHLANPQRWTESGVDLVLGNSASSINRNGQTVTLADGTVVPYHRLLLATGGSARKLALADAESAKIHSIRTYADVQRLRPLLAPGTRIVIIGGGFIGLEIASTARSLGCSVTIVEGANRLLGRAVPPEIAERVTHLHWSNGVELSLGCLPESITEDHAGVHISLQNGQNYNADLVVIGIGMQPRTELAVHAGLAVDVGVIVDERLRTSDHRVFAAGDVCQFPSWIAGKSSRQETWHNAQMQAEIAAANMLGQQLAYHEPPWFWSDQFDHTLQVGGDPALAETTIIRLTQGGGVIQFHLDQRHRVVGFSGFGESSLINRDLKIARKLVERGGLIDARSLADHQVPLKRLLSV